MARRLDRIVVIDVESTCWQGAVPAGQTAEIIEIGLCLLDTATWQRETRHSILVKPQHSRVSPFCTQLTTLTQAQVDGGIPFATACAILRRDFLTKERTWASYGDYDRRQFERQCATWGVAYPFGVSHINVKNLYALQQGLTHEVSLLEASQRWGWSLEGTYHRGDDDAWNIARVLGRLLGG